MIDYLKYLEEVKNGVTQSEFEDSKYRLKITFEFESEKVAEKYHLKNKKNGLKFKNNEIYIGTIENNIGIYLITEKLLESSKVIENVKLLNTASNIKNIRVYLHELEEVPEIVFNISNLLELNSSSSWGLSRLTTKLPRLENLKILNLDGNSISTVPKSLFKLQNLEVLILNGNGLGLKKIPPEISQLNKLVLFEFEGEMSEIPDELVELTKLKYLSLSGKFQELPNNFEKLSSLVYLSIHSRRSFRNLASIGNLSSLKKLYWSNNYNIPGEIFSLINLEELNLSISTQNIDKLGQLKNLIKLTITSDLTSLSDSLAKLTKLKELTLSMKMDNKPIPLKNCLGLESLELQNREQYNIAQIVDLPQLKKLMIFPEMLNKIELFYNLKELYVYRISDKTPLEVDSLKNLEILTLDGGKLMTLPQELANLKNLKEINLIDIEIHKIPYELNTQFCLGKDKEDKSEKSLKEYVEEYAKMYTFTTKYQYKETEQTIYYDEITSSNAPLYELDAYIKLSKKLNMNISNFELNFFNKLFEEQKNLYWLEFLIKLDCYSQKIIEEKIDSMLLKDTFTWIEKCNIAAFIITHKHRNFEELSKKYFEQSIQAIKIEEKRREDRASCYTLVADTICENNLHINLACDLYKMAKDIPDLDNPTYNVLMDYDKDLFINFYKEAWNGDLKTHNTYRNKQRIIEEVGSSNGLNDINWAKSLLENFFIIGDFDSNSFRHIMECSILADKINLKELAKKYQLVIKDNMQKKHISINLSIEQQVELLNNLLGEYDEYLHKYAFKILENLYPLVIAESDVNELIEVLCNFQNLIKQDLLKKVLKHCALYSHDYAYIKTLILLGDEGIATQAVEDFITSYDISLYDYEVLKIAAITESPKYLGNEILALKVMKSYIDKTDVDMLNSYDLSYALETSTSPKYWTQILKMLIDKTKATKKLKEIINSLYGHLKRSNNMIQVMFYATIEDYQDEKLKNKLLKIKKELIFK